MESGSCLLVLATVTRRVSVQHRPWWASSVSSGWTLEWVAVVKSHDCLHSVKIQPGGLFGAVGRDGMNGDRVFSSVRPRGGGGGSGLDGAGHHAVRRVWKLGRHGRYLAARRVGARSALRETDLRDTREQRSDTCGHGTRDSVSRTCPFFKSGVTRPQSGLRGFNARTHAHSLPNTGSEMFELSQRAPWGLWADTLWLTMIVINYRFICSATQQSNHFTQEEHAGDARAKALKHVQAYVISEGW